MAKKKAAAKKAAHKSINKTQFVAEVAEATELQKAQVRAVLDGVVAVMGKHLKKDHVVTVPGIIKLVVARRPPRAERTGRNPFTGEEQVFAAKPASKTVRGRVPKTVKDIVD